MTTRIVRVGNTLSVEIPAELVAQASLPVGEPVEWVSDGNGSISLVASNSWEHRHIRAGMAELEAGKGVPNERVMEWLDSWGTDNKPSRAKLSASLDLAERSLDAGEGETYSAESLSGLVDSVEHCGKASLSRG